MNSKPEVSVVMSVYNGSGYLKEAVESILNQEKVDLEFIIINDGSTDDSQFVLEQYEKEDSRVRLFCRNNQGLTKALIFGCEQATANFIARQDADDLSAVTRLRKQLDLFHQTPSLVMVSSWSKILGPNNEIMGETQRPEDPTVATSELLFDRLGPPGHGSVSFRRDAYLKVGGYRPQFYYSQDSDLWLRLARLGEIAYVPSFLYSYRYTSSGISGRLRPIQREFGQLALASHQACMNDMPESPFLEIAENLTEKICNGDYNKGVGRKSLADANYFIGSSLQKNMGLKASHYFLEAIKSDPLHLRAWLKLLLCTFNKTR